MQMKGDLRWMTVFNRLEFLYLLGCVCHCVIKQGKGDYFKNLVKQDVI